MEFGLGFALPDLSLFLVFTHGRGSYILAGVYLAGRDPYDLPYPQFLAARAPIRVEKQDVARVERNNYPIYLPPGDGPRDVRRI